MSTRFTVALDGTPHRLDFDARTASAAAERCVEGLVADGYWGDDDLPELVYVNVSDALTGTQTRFCVDIGWEVSVSAIRVEPR